MKIRQTHRSLTPAAQLAAGMGDRPLPKKVAGAVSRAMAGSVQENSADAVNAVRRGENRDYDREALGSQLYEDLRRFSKEQLIEICQREGIYADGTFGRQTLIGAIIDELLSRGSSDKMGFTPTEGGKE